jgi:hypothetical protein
MAQNTEPVWILCRYATAANLLVKELLTALRKIRRTKLCGIYQSPVDEWVSTLR